MTTLNLQVGASADDCYRRLAPDSFDLASALYNGDNTSSYYDYSSGMRFESVTIPQGDTIDAAVLQFRAAALSGSIPLTKIDGEDADAAATFSTKENYDGRGRTATIVNWTPGAWVVDTWYTSSEIKGVIQDITDRETWSSGNALAVFWNHDVDGWGGSQKRLEAWSYNDGTASAPKLDIDYTAGGEDVTVTPPTATLTLATFAPTVTATANITVTPGTLSLSLATFTPILGLSVIPPPLALTLATFAPTVTVTANQVVTPPVLALTLATFVPTVSTTAHVTITPPTATLTLAAFAPTVTVTGDVTVTPGVLALTLAAFAPTVTVTGDVTVTPSTATLTLTPFAPTVTTPRLVTPGVLALTLATFAPTVTITGDVTVTPGVLALTLATFAPTVSAPRLVTPSVLALTLATFAPTIAVAVAYAAVQVNTGAFSLKGTDDAAITLPSDSGTISLKPTDEGDI